jgi:hypothetical protein
MRNKLLGLIFILISLSVFGQKTDKLPRFFSEPVIVDSSSTLIIPLRYKTDLFASSKIGNDYYANILFYNFVTDSSKRLFKEDMFIKEFRNDYYSYSRYEKIGKQDNITNNWIFYFVKVDYNKNGRIDNDDPSILFVSDKHGNGLKPITPANENVISLSTYEKQGFALLKIQVDSDLDKDFDSNDKEYYCIRLDLKTLTFGNRIEIK